MTPVRIDPAGITGPTRGQARGPRWTAVAHGWYVPASAPLELVEQRILNQAVRLPPNGAITAWACLRWRGGGFFDGTSSGRELLPIPLIVGTGGDLRTREAATLSWEQLAPTERELVHGLPCTTVCRALFDEVRRRGSLRSGVVAADMAMAAGLLTEQEFRNYVGRRSAWTGVPLVRKVLPLIDVRSVSPQESLLRLVWVLDARLPPPLCNQDLCTDSGEFLGRPDLLDPEVGLVGEYDGADHLADDRRRHDRAREERFRDHGLEVVTVVRGEIGEPDRVARRIRAAYERARTTTRRQTWSLTG